MKPMFALMLTSVLGLTGCSSPGLYTNIGIGPGGVTVTPVATARVGGARISVSP
jgi:hypothetical protein